MKVVVKIGTSSITSEDGSLDLHSFAHVAQEVHAAIDAGHEVVVVSSGAISAGLPLAGLSADNRPKDSQRLQAISAIGQTQLMTTWSDAFAEAGRHVVAQVLLSPLDFMDRRQYLHARTTLGTLLSMKAVPIINENDVVADDAIRFGDNDRIAALVSQLIGAQLLVLLTDTDGVYTEDPRNNDNAKRIEHISNISNAMSVGSGSGSNRGSGGMATKLLAAQMASWCGIRTVIANAQRGGVVNAAIAGNSDVGTAVAAQEKTLPARKVWIAFAVDPVATITLDQGAFDAIAGGASVLGAGVTAHSSEFARDDALNIAGPNGDVFARGLARASSHEMSAGVVVHRDDMVMLPS